VKIVICPPTYRPLLAKKKAEAKAKEDLLACVALLVLSLSKLVESK